MTVTAKAGMSPEEAIARVKQGADVSATLIRRPSIRAYLADLEEACRDEWQTSGRRDVIAALRDHHEVTDLFTEDAD